MTMTADLMVIWYDDENDDVMMVICYDDEDDFLEGLELMMIMLQSMTTNGGSDGGCEGVYTGSR